MSTSVSPEAFQDEALAVNVQRQLEQQRVFVSLDWAKSALYFLQCHGPYAQDPVALTQHVLALFLSYDIALCKRPDHREFDPQIQNMHNERVFKERAVVLQVDSLVNISSSKNNQMKKMLSLATQSTNTSANPIEIPRDEGGDPLNAAAQEDEAEVGRMNKLLLTDGHTHIVALDLCGLCLSLSPQNNAKSKIAVGTKLALSCVKVLRGALLLDSASVRMLGGSLSLPLTTQTQTQTQAQAQLPTQIQAQIPTQRPTQTQPLALPAPPQHTSSVVGNISMSTPSYVASKNVLSDFTAPLAVPTRVSSIPSPSPNVSVSVTANSNKNNNNIDEMAYTANAVLVEQHSSNIIDCTTPINVSNKSSDRRSTSSVVLAGSGAGERETRLSSSISVENDGDKRVSLPQRVSLCERVEWEREELDFYDAERERDRETASPLTTERTHTTSSSRRVSEITKDTRRSSNSFENLQISPLEADAPNADTHTDAHAANPLTTLSYIEDVLRTPSHTPSHTHSQQFVVRGLASRLFRFKIIRNTQESSAEGKYCPYAYDVVVELDDGRCVCAARVSSHLLAHFLGLDAAQAKARIGSNSAGKEALRALMLRLQRLQGFFVVRRIHDRAEKDSNNTQTGAQAPLLLIEERLDSQQICRLAEAHCAPR